MSKNKKCVISSSVLCKWLGKSCDDCYVNNFRDDEEARKVLADFQVTLSLLPDTIDELMGDSCCFCVGDKRARAAYAVVDFAHREPESKRGMFFGMGKKVRQRIGSLMPVSISICKRCRSNFRRLDTIKWLSLLAGVAVGIGFCFLPAVNASPALPYAVVLLGGVVGYIAGKVLAQVYLGAKGKQTRFNVFDIPVCTQMREGGWFTVADNGPVTHLMFMKKPLMRKLSDIGERANGAQADNSKD